MTFWSKILRRKVRQLSHNSTKDGNFPKLDRRRKHNSFVQLKRKHVALHNPALCTNSQLRRNWPICLFVFIGLTELDSPLSHSREEGVLFIRLFRGTGIFATSSAIDRMLRIRNVFTSSGLKYQLKPSSRSFSSIQLVTAIDYRRSDKYISTNGLNFESETNTIVQKYQAYVTIITIKYSDLCKVINYTYQTSECKDFVSTLIFKVTLSLQQRCKQLNGIYLTSRQSEQS